jgi:hypothetical protein
MGWRLGWIFTLATAFVLPAGGAAWASGFLRVLDEMQQAYARVDHHTANFLVQERLHDGLSAEHWGALD